MSGLLSNTFLISDVDGTLLDDKGQISKKNLLAIKELTEAGGKFTIATGRGVSMFMPVAKALDLKESAVIFNGAQIYDFVNKKSLWHCDMPADAVEYIKMLSREFPSAAFEVLVDDKVYVPAINELEHKHLAMGNVSPVMCGFDEIPREGIIKSLIVDLPENIDIIMDFIAKNSFEKADWVRSAHVYYEMLPLGVNKGAGLKKLLELTGNQERYVVAVGDFMNDIEMLKIADLGVAVNNAQECVKKAADIIVADNNSDAVYATIKHLK